jgi:hypothetical protein
MKPKPLSSLNHLTVPVAILFLHVRCAGYAEDAVTATTRRPALICQACLLGLIEIEPSS